MKIMEAYLDEKALKLYLVGQAWLADSKHIHNFEDE